MSNTPVIEIEYDCTLPILEKRKKKLAYILRPLIRIAMLPILILNSFLSLLTMISSFGHFYICMMLFSDNSQLFAFSAKSAMHYLIIGMISLLILHFLFYAYHRFIKGEKLTLREKISLMFKHSHKKLSSLSFKLIYRFYDLSCIYYNGKKEKEFKYSSLKFIKITDSIIVANRYIYFEKDIIGEETFRMIQDFLTQHCPSRRILGEKENILSLIKKR